jgi:hypothetical protein
MKKCGGGGWMYRPMYSRPRHYLEVSDKLHAPTALPSGERAPAIREETMWAPEPIWKTWIGEKSGSYRDSNSEPSAVQPVASRYTDCAIPVQ